ncbi:unnamed protein product [Arabis nemorensis]|uniref:EB domain-containing protein n=1 Tax=Arabis nemorensis TaxID=586526 RepID=A0A565BRP7_9BRAS|nr:unnamed protein product [Arabis nemorensis]
MASNIFFLIALVIACATIVSVPTTEAQIFLPCKTTKECEYLQCTKGLIAKCVNGQCKCSNPQAKLNNLKFVNPGGECTSTSQCNPHMSVTCVTHMYACFVGLCTCLP